MSQDSPNPHNSIKSIPSARDQVGKFVTTTLRGLVPGETGVTLANTNEPITDIHFDEKVCRNCGEACTTAFCGSCGQELAKRISYRDVWKEIWERHRIVEMSVVHTIMRLLVRPGTISREYVLGVRKRYVHPLNLLLAAIGFLVLLLSQLQYLTVGQPNLTPLMEQVASWSQWSFSVGLVAIWLSATLIFWGKLAYNLVEKAVLAAYTQVAIIAVNLINLAPLLFFNTTQAIVRHREIANLYMGWVETALVAVAFYQFFRIQWRRDGWQLLLGVAAYYFLKQWLVMAYARLIVRIVLGM